MTTNPTREQDIATVLKYLDAEKLRATSPKDFLAALDRLATMPSRDEVLDVEKLAIRLTGELSARAVSCSLYAVHNALEAALKSPPTLQPAKEA